MENSVFTTEEIKEIIDNLYATIGVRMNVDLSRYPSDEFSSNVSRSSFFDVAKVVTDHLELPVFIRPKFSSSFVTKGLVMNKGNTTTVIGAQIMIPENLPWYKTAAMKNFPIDITVPQEALNKGRYYLMTMLSHEFSHIYLHSRRDPQKESEWATDLCALMMGFVPLWKIERRQQRCQGYLSDAEFDFAINYIYRLRRPFEKLRKKLSSLKQDIQKNCDEISRYLEEVRLLHDFHFKHPQTSFKHMEDAAVFSKLAQFQYKADAEKLLKDSKREVNAIVKPLQDKRDFYEKDKKWMESNVEILSAIEERLRQKIKELKQDYAVLLQNIDTEHHTKIFKIRVKALAKGILEANKSIQLIHKKAETLDECMAYYEKYKKEHYVKETDEKTFSLICNADYAERSAIFIKEKQEKVREIDAFMKEARDFYSIDEETLLSKIEELDNMVSALNYCLKEQESCIHVVTRNLSFTGKTKWMLRSFLR